MGFVDELRSRLTTKQREYERCKEEVRKAKEKEAELRQEITALQVLLSKEEPQKKSSGTPAPLATVAIDSGDKNKAEAVRNLIEETAGSEGLTPAQVRTLLESRGVSMPTNYLYSILLRSKKGGQIVERNGRYFPAEKEKAAS